MADERPPVPGDGGPDDVGLPDDVDDERLGAAMAALLGGAWPGAGEAGAGPGFTLPPPRRFEGDDEGFAEPAAESAGEAAAGGGMWDEPVPDEDFWASAGPAAPVEAWAGPPDSASDDAPVADEAAAPPLWSSVDEPTQAHTWSSSDDVPYPAEAAPVDEPALPDEPVPARGRWLPGEDNGAASLSAEEDVEQPAAEHGWLAAGDSWGNDPVRAAASGPAPEDQAALEQAGLAGPMNIALSDLRRLGGTDAGSTDLAVPAAAGGYSHPGKPSELQEWWSDRGRELLPGMVVAAVVVFAFAVVLLGRDSGSDGSKVDTARAAVPTVVPPTPTTAPTTAPPDLSTAAEALLGEPLGEPLGGPVFSEPPPTGGVGSPAAKKPAPKPQPRRPSSGAPAAVNPAPPGGAPGGSPGGPAPTAPPGPTPTTRRTAPTTVTTEPDEPPPTTRDRCQLLPQLCEP